MGYYTDYEMIPARYNPGILSQDKYLTIEAFIEEGIKVDGCSYLSDVWYGRGNTLTWHDHRKDMARFSIVFPNTLFTLWGHEQEVDEQWKEYYFGGKCQVALAIIIYPEFDKEQLKSVDSVICPACLGTGVLDADGIPPIGCPKCWGAGEIE